MQLVAVSPEGVVSPNPECANFTCTSQSTLTVVPNPDIHDITLPATSANYAYGSGGILDTLSGFLHNNLPWKNTLADTDVSVTMNIPTTASGITQSGNALVTATTTATGEYTIPYEMCMKPKTDISTDLQVFGQCELSICGGGGS